MSVTCCGLCVRAVAGAVEMCRGAARAYVTEPSAAVPLPRRPPYLHTRTAHHHFSFHASTLTLTNTGNLLHRKGHGDWGRGKNMSVNMTSAQLPSTFLSRSSARCVRFASAFSRCSGVSGHVGGGGAAVAHHRYAAWGFGFGLVGSGSGADVWRRGGGVGVGGRVGVRGW